MNSLERSSDQENSLQFRSNPSGLITLPDILKALTSLEEEETQLSDALSSLLFDDEPVQSALGELESLASHLDEINNDAVILSKNVHTTAQTAERVGGRVRILDEEMKRVKEAAERVGQVIELKSSFADVQSSMEAQDWETATRLCARIMALPLEVIAGAFAEVAVPTAETPLSPVQTLQTFREKLRDIFLTHFRQACKLRDANTITRFFKLFPPIGWEQEGIEAYASFVLDLVQTKAPPAAKTSSPLYYVTALTALYESVCSIIDQHQPVVEKYYGQGKMKIVAESLVHECDGVTDRLLDGWGEERDIKRKLLRTNFSPPPVTNVGSSRKQPLQSLGPDESIEPREIDKVLNEIAAMTMRYTAFRRFLYSNLQVDESSSGPSLPNGKQSADVDIREPSGFDSRTSDVDILDHSRSKILFETLLSKYYIPMETWYLRYAIDQAHKTSTVDSSQTPPITSVPDLAFYLLKVVIFRILSTGSEWVLNGIAKQLRDIVEHDYVNVIKRKLDEVYRVAGTGSVRTEKSEKDNRFNFIVLLNDLDVSSVHMDRLSRDVLSSQLLLDNFLENERPNVKANLSIIVGLTPKIHSILKSGLDLLFNQLIRPRLRNLIPDIYKEVSYALDEDSYLLAESQDHVRKRFTKAWENILDGFKESLTESNYSTLFGLCIDIIMRPWEKYILTLRYSELGAIRFDHDIRAVATYLSAQTPFGDIRNKFQRVQQISMLLNIDKEENVDDFFSNSGIAWKLTMTEARAIVGLRI